MTLAAAHVPWSGEPPPSSRPPTCRRTGCAEPAGGDGLCADHERSQAALRASAEPRGTDAHAVPVPAWLADLAVAREAPWRQHAACSGLTATMYPEAVRGASSEGTYAEAQALCATCPVTEPCLADGARERHGCWGGTTPRQRFPRGKVA